MVAWHDGDLGPAVRWEGDRYGAQEEWDEEQKWLAVNEVSLLHAHRL